MENKRIVVIGDVRDSRRIKDKPMFERKLDSTLSWVNETYPIDIQAKFKRIKGIDEIGGVLRRIDNLYEIISGLFDRVLPERIRLVAIYDIIDISLDSSDVASMDGNAFHIAAENINSLKKNGLFFEMSYVDPLLDECISGYVNLLYLYKQRWSDRQREIVSKYRDLMNQSDVAKQLGVSQQSVSNMLRRSHWSKVHILEGRLSEALGHYGSNMENEPHD